MMLGLLGSAILGGGVAVGGYKLLEPERDNSPQALAADPNVRYTSALKSSTYAVSDGLNFTAAWPGACTGWWTRGCSTRLQHSFHRDCARAARRLLSK